MYRKHYFSRPKSLGTAACWSQCLVTIGKYDSVSSGTWTAYKYNNFLYLTD